MNSQKVFYGVLTPSKRKKIVEQFITAISYRKTSEENV
jgi:hypothetical protein